MSARHFTSEDSVLAVVPVDLLRARLEYIIEEALPEYAYATDLSVFVGRLFDMAIWMGMEESYKTMEQLCQSMANYGDLSHHELTELIHRCLNITTGQLRGYTGLSWTSWHWLDARRDHISIAIGDF